jgi:hypothetical protein
VRGAHRCHALNHHAIAIMCRFGQEVAIGRRDLRAGQQAGTVEAVPGGVRVSFKWVAARVQAIAGFCTP